MIAARPLTIAEIFDRTVTIVVHRWRVVVALAVINATPPALITAFTHGNDQVGPPAWLSFVVSVLVGSLTFSPLVRLGGDPGAPDDVGALLRRAVRDYGRSLGSFLLVYVVLFAVIVVAGVIVAAGVLAFRFLFGPSASPITTVIVILLLIVAAMPFWVATSVAYANVILEGVGPWEGLTSAVARVRTSPLARTWLLGAAMVIVSFAPVLVIDALLRPLATSTGIWWLVLPEGYLATATGITFGTVAGAVAAVDYRNRREGADLQAVLDASVPAP